MKEQVISVQRMQEYIEEHLEEEITLSDLSEASYFSPWHSYRLFREYTGFSPAKYIHKLRLSRSAMRLKKEKYSVTDAAHDYGFSSVDGYIRAFFREFNVTPCEYAKVPIPISLFIPYGVKFIELRKEIIDMENIKNIFVQVVQKQERNVITKRGIVRIIVSPTVRRLRDIWGLLISMDCGEPISLWLPKAYQKENTSTYVQRIEVELDYKGKIPKGFDIITLPAAEYLIASGPPFIEEDYSQAILAVQYSIDHYDPQ